MSIIQFTVLLSFRAIIQFMELLFGHGDHSIQGIFIHPSLVIHFKEFFINPGACHPFHETPGAGHTISENSYLSWVGDLLLGSPLQWWASVGFSYFLSGHPLEDMVYLSYLDVPVNRILDRDKRSSMVVLRTNPFFEVYSM